eukprot:TRINITY_DN6868_c0_g1_i4.p1 TRINITY_DN6868_c0_g1~~TRINITY_DN6868_c0_g1_i4.p1  ORF type:complete len:739 (-),score=111.86 TRINITY_DN6868_c0_g1_i4:1308-3524(-)
MDNSNTHPARPSGGLPSAFSSEIAAWPELFPELGELRGRPYEFSSSIADPSASPHILLGQGHSQFSHGTLGTPQLQSSGYSFNQPPQPQSSHANLHGSVLPLIGHHNSTNMGFSHPHSAFWRSPMMHPSDLSAVSPSPIGFPSSNQPMLPSFSLDTDSPIFGSLGSTPNPHMHQAATIALPPYARLDGSDRTNAMESPFSNQLSYTSFSNPSSIINSDAQRRSYMDQLPKSPENDGDPRFHSDSSEQRRVQSGGFKYETDNRYMSMQDSSMAKSFSGSVNGGAQSLALDILSQPRLPGPDVFSYQSPAERRRGDSFGDSNLSLDIPNHSSLKSLQDDTPSMSAINPMHLSHNDDQKESDMPYHEHGMSSLYRDNELSPKQVDHSSGVSDASSPSQIHRGPHQQSFQAPSSFHDLKTQGSHMKDSPLGSGQRADMVYSQGQSNVYAPHHNPSLNHPVHTMPSANGNSSATNGSSSVKMDAPVESGHQSMQHTSHTSHTTHTTHAPHAPHAAIGPPLTPAPPHYASQMQMQSQQSQIQSQNMMHSQGHSSSMGQGGHSGHNQASQHKEQHRATRVCGGCGLEKKRVYRYLGASAPFCNACNQHWRRHLHECQLCLKLKALNAAEDLRGADITLYQGSQRSRKREQSPTKKKDFLFDQSIARRKPYDREISSVMGRPSHMAGIPPSPLSHPPLHPSLSTPMSSNGMSSYTSHMHSRYGPHASSNSMDQPHHRALTVRPPSD